jgi:hypothetical protein
MSWRLCPRRRRTSASREHSLRSRRAALGNLSQVSKPMRRQFPAARNGNRQPQFHCDSLNKAMVLQAFWPAGGLPIHVTCVVERSINHARRPLWPQLIGSPPRCRQVGAADSRPGCAANCIRPSHSRRCFRQGRAFHRRKAPHDVRIRDDDGLIYRPPRPPMERQRDYISMKQSAPISPTVARPRRESGCATSPNHLCFRCEHFSEGGSACRKQTRPPCRPRAIARSRPIRCQVSV